MGAVDMSAYKDVAQRIADFREKYPDGSLRPLDPAQPYRVEVIGEQTFIVYAAAAFRSPMDEAPGVGVAWEPFPGKTNFTRDSELQNAETSAWGRAIVAALASESKQVASAEDVERRRNDAQAAEQRGLLLSDIKKAGVQAGWSPDDIKNEYARLYDGLYIAEGSEPSLRSFLEYLTRPDLGAPPNAAVPTAVPDSGTDELVPPSVPESAPLPAATEESARLILGEAKAKPRRLAALIAQVKKDGLADVLVDGRPLLAALEEYLPTDSAPEPGRIGKDMAASA